MKVIGFLINPIAGMGGSVGLKGTDGDLLVEALRRGARPIAPYRADRFLRRLRKLINSNLTIVTPPKIMGENAARKYFNSVETIDFNVSEITSSADTINSCKLMISRGVDLIVFVGGDGTARDVYSIIRDSVPILGVPSGVKMYSGVFASSPEAAAEVVKLFIDGNAELDLCEIADVDERSLGMDEIRIRIYGIAKVPSHPNLIVPSKDFSGNDIDNKEEVAEYMVSEVMKPNTLYLLGPGSTVKAIADKLGVKKTLLGVDAVYNGRLVGKDLSESDILNLLSMYNNVKVIVSPIGGQGFIFGRGNQQISARVLRIIGKENVIVISTRNKIANLRFLRVDTGEPVVDNYFEGYIRVIVGYNEEAVVRVRSFTGLDDE